ncbi:zinc-ribbon domain-containing protein [Lacrimispora amygdalina]|uniref:zinc-ribbon domain-containing protein n=1 Tax=Lacrimispora amygdalina TaxID=253257 RepID=UPI000BE2C714|nr:zinc ribbon domain-containing protein [Lacrimispora amygdalina]
MKIICPDCEKELPEGKKFCPTCGTPGLNEEEYKRYKRALDNTDTNMFEHALVTEADLDDTIPSPELVDKTVFSNERVSTQMAENTIDVEKEERKSSISKENCSESDSHCNCSDHCADDDLENIRFWPIGISKINLIKAAIGITCFVGIITFGIKYLKRKK